MTAPTSRVAPSRRGVIFDLVAAQSPSYRGRGIARYSTDLVRAMVRFHPELVSAIVVHPDLAPVEDLDDLAPWLTAKPEWSAGAVVHLSSVFEPEVPVRTFWPREASANRLLVATTVYDLIPDIYPQWYLQDPGLRRRWRCCREVARTADAVLTLSECARTDVVRMLGVPEGRAHFIGSGCSDVFKNASAPQEAWKTARRAVKGLKPNYVVYVGAFNPRKNVDRLVEAYAALPKHLTDEHQLVIGGQGRPLERNHYLVMADKMGLRGRVLVPGYVPEKALVSLYQCAELNVFPSLYEGYGLPVVEAMACGTPTIAGNNSSLTEILPPFALFDASDPGAISEAMARALSDGPFRQRLRRLTQHEPPSWEAVADRAAAVFETMLAQAERRRPAWRTRPQLALVGAPPGLAEALKADAAVDSFGLPGCVPGEAMPYAALRHLDAWRSGYDSIVAWQGNDEDDATATSGAMEPVEAEWPGRVITVSAAGTEPGPSEAAPGWRGTAQRVLSQVDDSPALRGAG